MVSLCTLSQDLGLLFFFKLSVEFEITTLSQSHIPHALYTVLLEQPPYSSKPCAQ